MCVHCSVLVGVKGWHEGTFPVILHHIYWDRASHPISSSWTVCPGDSFSQLTEHSNCMWAVSPSQNLHGCWLLAVVLMLPWQGIYILAISPFPILFSFHAHTLTVPNEKIIAAFYLCFYLDLRADTTVCVWGVGTADMLIWKGIVWHEESVIFKVYLRPSCVLCICINSILHSSSSHTSSDPSWIHDFLFCNYCCYILFTRFPS